MFKKLLRKFGYVKIRKKRAYFEGAGNSSLLSAWATSNYSSDQVLRSDLSALRARSRELQRNNGFAKKFIRMVKTNVVGAKGIILQARVKNNKGQPDELANLRIEEAWGDWSKVGNCDITGELSFRDIQKIVIGQAAGDGEILIRKIRGSDVNKFGFALQLIEADHLDVKYNGTAPNGNKIRMGIEFDDLGRRAAYWLYKKHPGDYMVADYRYGDRERVPADEIIHFYIKNRISQNRGLPWMHAVMVNIHQLNGYVEAELVGARIGSSKMGFFQNENGDGYKGDDTENGNPIIEVEPGVFEYLPPGWKFEGFDPQHPTSAFPYFVKSILRTIASGMDVSYNFLANDLEGVNYSSIRAGILDERDVWRDLQAYLAEHFCQIVYEEWLQMALVTRALNLPFSGIEKFKSVKWQPRGWQWVDPQKDVKANIEAIKHGLNTSQDILAEQGKDLDDVYRELEREKNLREKYNLKTPFDVKNV